MNAKAALIIAHPGHELRILRWVELHQPDVLVLTDGSGRSGKSRVQSTQSLLGNAGAHFVDSFKQVSDADFYTAILSRDLKFFSAIIEAIECLLESHEYTTVVTDGLEGFNPAHDLTHLMTLQAVRRLQKPMLRLFEFALDSNPSIVPENRVEAAVRIDLDDAAFERKVATAQKYDELLSETVAAVTAYGKEAFRTEYLMPVENFDAYLRFRDEKPQYESFGEQRVASGHYSSVIRFRDQIQPLIESLSKPMGVQRQ